MLPFAGKCGIIKTMAIPKRKDENHAEIHLSADHVPEQRVYSKAIRKIVLKSFREHSDAVFRQVAAELPDIGDSIFSFNYAYAPSYVAWYRSMRQLGLDAGQADDLMWKMNEKMLLSVPKPFLHMAGEKLSEQLSEKRRNSTCSDRENRAFRNTTG